MPTARQPLILAIWPTRQSRTRVASLEAGTYKRHRIHGEERTWTETNCYTDLLVELVHGLAVAPEPFDSPLAPGGFVL